MRIEISVIGGEDRGRSVEFDSQDLILIGRGTNTDLQLTDPRVSKAHCRIVIKGVEVWLQDADSAWGTVVNGERIKEARLRPGDLIRLGETELDVRVASDPIRATLLPPGGPLPRPAPLEKLASPPRSPAQAPKPVESESAPKAPPPPKESRPLPAVPGHLRTEPMMPAPRKKPVRLQKVVRRKESLPQTLTAEDLIGERVEKVTIGELIARTPSGFVFRGQMYGRDEPVAIKLFHPSAAGEDAQRQRIERAGEAGLKLKHRNLVAVLDYGDYRGAPFIVSEFVDGESAADLLKRTGVGGMLDVADTLRIMHGVACALEYASQHNIVHRNIGPKSILVRKDDKLVKLGDLTLARSTDANQAARLTQSGEMIGDLNWLAPEQTTDGTLDQRTDLYNLGAVVYGLLTGRPPIEGRNPADTLARIPTEVPEPPTKYHLAVPPLFEGVIMTTLQKRPGDRYQNAAELLKELQGVAGFVNVDLPDDR